MESGKQKKVMVAIDGSDCSHYALDWTLQNLRDSIASSDFVVFTVQDLTDYSYLSASTFGASSAELIRVVQENHNNAALALLEKAKEICNKYGFAAKTVTEVGYPKEAICAAVEKFNIELLVLGNHGRGALQRAFLGSVSNYCVHNAKCPVLVVKKPA